MGIVMAALGTILLLWMTFCFLRERKKEEVSGAAALLGGMEEEQTGWLTLFLIPAGMRGAGLVRKLSLPFMKRRGKRFLGPVKKLFTQMKGEREGERLYSSYLARQAGYVMFAFMICCFLYAGVEGITRPVKNVEKLERKEFGEGGYTERLTMQIGEGDSSFEQEIALRIPEKKQPKEAAAQELQEALDAVQSGFQGRVIQEELRFPREYGRCALRFQSLTPEVMRSDGTFTEGFSEERKKVFFRVEGFLGEETEERLFSMEVAALSELSEAEKARQVQRDLLAGAFTTEGAIELPSAASDGTPVSFRKQEADRYLAWVMLFILLPAGVTAAASSRFQQKAKDREEAVRAAFPEFLSELSILIGAGLSAQNAWIRIGEDMRKSEKETEKFFAKDPLRMEAVRIGKGLKEGAGLTDSMLLLREHLPLPEIKRLSALLIESVQRGNAYLLLRLSEMSEEAWEKRKRQVREKSEEADTKLLFPMMLMLIAVLLLVLAPSIMNFSG